MMPSTNKRFFAMLTLAWFFSTSVMGANVDLASVPLVSMSTKVVRPNVMFILDDSGSMGWDYMPDGIDVNDTRPCFKNFGYNRIYFNPGNDYDPAVNADGTSKANASITAAWNNGFNTGAGTTDLTSVTTITNYTPGPSIALPNNPLAMTAGSNTFTVNAGAAHGLTAGTVVVITGLNTSSGRTNNLNINGNQLTIINTPTANTFRLSTASVNGRTATNTTAGTGGNGASYRVMTPSYTYVPNHGYYVFTATPGSPPSTCSADGNYTFVPVGSMTAAEQQKYANWYSYYRTRMLMMKTASGRAFSTVDDRFRVGYTTISETGTAAARWLDNSRFNAAHKTAWYTKLYGATPGGFTPLRGALSKAGRYYAGTLVTGNTDPVQYSCQKNFSILTTDGYWNKNNESPSYGPKREDNVTDVGDQDSDITTSPRPMYEAGAYSDTLADVARYYSKTDLRTTTAQGGLRDDGLRAAVNANAQDSNGVDLPDGHQHMKTITLGLGMTGVLNYPGDETGLTSGSVNWPDPQTGTDGSIPARLDDLWHAGINGGGTYASASDPEDVVDALRNALSIIADREQAGAAAATSSLEPVAGDNFAYVAKFTTVSWTGDLEARTIDTNDATVSTAEIWSARDQLDPMVSATSDTRTIYTWNSAGTARVPFTLANVNAADFSSSSLSQWSTWNSTQKSNATAGEMINFLRGQHDFEMRVDATHTDLNKRLFRKRLHVLGDIVNSSPVYVKKPPFRYSDSGYAAFVGTNSTRASTIYAGANDGMLHAFDAETGEERWAYVPRMLHGEMYKLADASYASNHRYYVDGVITVGDVYDGSAWRTILVAGLGGGGKGYFALDVTDPVNPLVLWEYTNSNLGYTYGNPVITKRASDGAWVVLFASGYNNTTGDSRGRLFMLNPVTGVLMGSVATSGGSNPDLSGLAKITGWTLDTMVDNSTRYVYGGDLAGNLWRFDINTMAVQKLGQTSATPGARPITARPEVGRLRDSGGNYHRVVYVGTGRYLGANDVSGGTTPESTEQLMLAVKDTGSDLGTLTALGANLVQQTLDISGTPRTIPAPQPVNWLLKNGWYITIPLGERVNVDPRLQLGAIGFVANNPQDDYCTFGGSSWFYVLDYRTGGAVSSRATNAVGALVSSSSVSTGMGIIGIGGSTYAIIMAGDANTHDAGGGGAGGGAVRRVGYREIN